MSRYSVKTRSSVKTRPFPYTVSLLQDIIDSKTQERYDFDTIYAYRNMTLKQLLSEIKNEIEPFQITEKKCDKNDYCTLRLTSENTFPAGYRKGWFFEQAKGDVVTYMLV